jgi:hypothetical protein
MSKATETAVKLLESLPEETQDTLIEALRQLVQEAQDETQWNQRFKNRDGLIAAARKARADVAASKATEMDYERL